MTIWKVHRCPLRDLEKDLNEFTMNQWHVWPQQIHILHDHRYVEPTCVVICSKEIGTEEDTLGDEINT